MNRRSGNPKLIAKRGQTMVEYVFTAVILMSAVAVLAVFLYSYKEHTSRVMNLAASEYP